MFALYQPLVLGSGDTKAMRQGPCPTAVHRAVERLDDQSFHKLRADRVLHRGAGCGEGGASTEGGELSLGFEAQL